MNYAVRITLAAASPVPSYTGGFWSSGIAALLGSGAASSWTNGVLLGVSAVGEKVDISQHGNYAMLDDCDVAISAVGWTDFFAAGASIHNATVEVGTISGSTFTARWVGAVVDSVWSGVEISLQCESLATRRHKDIPTRSLTSDELPNLPQASEGAAVPIVWGAVERMTPPKRSQDRQYLDAFYRVESGVIVSALSSSFLYDTPSGTNFSIAVYGRVDSTPLADVPATYWAEIAASSGKTAYAEITSGTGSGQTRAVTSIGVLATINNLGVSAISLVSAFSPQPDFTSVVRFFVNSDYISIAVCDEGAGIIVSSDVDDKEFPLISTVEDVGGVQVASASAEFITSGEYAATKYMKPSSDYGIAILSDGIAQTGSAQFLAKATTRCTDDFGITFLTADVFCLARFDAIDIPKLEDSDKMFFTYSAEGYNLGSAKGQIVLHGIAATYANDADTAINYYRTGAYGPINAYSPGMATDGAFGNFALNARQLSASALIPGRAKALYLCASAESVDGIGGADIANWVRVDDGAIPSGATSFVAAFDTAGGSGYFPVGEYIQPILLGDAGESEWQNSRCTYDDCGADGGSDRFIGTRFSEWREIIGINILSSFSYAGRTWGRVQYTIATPYSDAYGECRIVRKTATLSRTVPVKENESGLAISYGSFTPSSTFLASVESGRTYSAAWPSLPSGKSLGVPITTAPHAALDMMYRDLGLGSGDVDAASYLALPADPISAVLSSRRGSADVLAQMCAEFGWVAGHDSSGKETVKAASLDGSLGTAFDYAVANADIIADSITGPEMTAVEDVISLPTVSRSWTQADGSRSVASIRSLSLDPGDLTESNYKTYAPGFDSFAQAVEAYTALYEAVGAFGITQDGEHSFEMTSDIDGLLIDSGRLAWAASRKEILTFSVLESHAAAWAKLGSRIKVTHRRYATPAKYGALVARYWMPGDKSRVQLTMMIDVIV